MHSLICICLCACLAMGMTAGAVSAQKTAKTFHWKHISTETGDIGVPNPGAQQTATAVFDVDGDGDNDFLIAERTEAPAVVWYRRGPDGWDRYAVESGKCPIEAGSAVHDIDGDGDPDVVFGGDGGSNRVWWWENPSPRFDPKRPWARHLIKDGGANKHHDQMFGDFDGDGAAELVFWNQRAGVLFMAEIPDTPRDAAVWDMKEIYSWSSDSEMEQRGTYPGWRSTNEHEGFARADIDGDGIDDIIGGGRWFKYLGDGRFMDNIIDASYAFSRAATGQFIEGGRPEVVFVVGDGLAPLMLYEWREGTWYATEIITEVDNGHSIGTGDYNGDGHLDIFSAEMNLGGNDDARALLLFGDGRGNFESAVATEGYANHESRCVDLDGDGDYDILGKPYRWKAPRLDIWLNTGR